MTAFALNCGCDSTVHYTESDIRALYAQFNEKYPKDEDCTDAFFWKAYDAGLVHCKCGRSSFIKRYGERKVRCTHCLSIRSFTRGTVFERMRRVRAWLFLIHLLEQGIRVSANMFRKVVEVSGDSAWGMFKKLEMMLLSLMEEAAAIHTSCLAQLICKRSRETPARCHPYAEQEEIDQQKREDGDADAKQEASEQGHSQQNSNAHKSDLEEGIASLSGLQKELYDLLGNGPVYFDHLCDQTKSGAGPVSAALMMLELDRLIDSLPGNMYRRVAHSLPAQQHNKRAESSSKEETNPQLLNKIASFIREIRHRQGISRKYIQQNLASFWCCDDRNYWQNRSLILAGFEYGPVTRREILAYVTPSEAKIML